MNIKKNTRIQFILKYKYIITLLLFIVWMIFFDKHDVLASYKMYAQLQELKQQQHYYKEELAKTKQLQKAIFEHNSNLEKYAREKFYMKKDGEQLYVIVEE